MRLTKISLLSSISFVAVAVTFAVTALAPKQVSAATAIPLGGDKTSCIAKQVAVGDVAKLKTFGTEKINNRTKYLDKYYSSAAIDKKYDKLDKSFETAKAAANKKLGKDIGVSKPTYHKDALKADSTEIQNALKGKSQEVTAAADATGVATATCSVIWDMRVSSYVASKLKYQYAIDTYANKNAVNNALFKVAADKNKTTGIQNPSEIDARLAKLQSTLDLLKIDATKPIDIKAFNPEGTKGSEIFKTKLADLDAVKKDISTASTKLRTATKATTAERKAAKPAATSSSSSKPASSGSTGSSSSSSSGSDDSSSSSGGSTSSGGSSSSGSSSGDSSSSSPGSKDQPAAGKPKGKIADKSKFCKDLKQGKSNKDKKDWQNRSCVTGVNKANGGGNYGGDAAKACNAKDRKQNVYNACAVGYKAAYKTYYSKTAKDSGYKKTGKEQPAATSAQTTGNNKFRLERIENGCKGAYDNLKECDALQKHIASKKGDGKIPGVGSACKGLFKTSSHGKHDIVPGAVTKCRNAIYGTESKPVKKTGSFSSSSNASKEPSAKKKANLSRWNRINDGCRAENRNKVKCADLAKDMTADGLKNCSDSYATTTIGAGKGRTTISQIYQPGLDACKKEIDALK